METSQSDPSGISGTPFGMSRLTRPQSAKTGSQDRRRSWMRRTNFWDPHVTMRRPVPNPDADTNRAAVRVTPGTNPVHQLSPYELRYLAAHLEEAGREGSKHRVRLARALTR